MVSCNNQDAKAKKGRFHTDSDAIAYFLLYSTLSPKWNSKIVLLFAKAPVASILWSSILYDR